MSLLTLIASRQLEPKVKHSLPGRLRLTIPLIKQGGDGLQAQLEKILEKCVLPSGILSLQTSTATASLLIRYQPELLTEQQVLQWVTALKSEVTNLIRRFDKLPQDRKESAKIKFLHHYNSVDRVSIALNAQLEIPEHVWS